MASLLPEPPLVIRFESLNEVEAQVILPSTSKYFHLIRKSNYVDKQDLGKWKGP